MTLYSGLTDLDELALRVRNKATGKYVNEALRALRGGAYRAAIVTTWIATAYDLISKVRELAFEGDPAAVAYVGRLQRAIDNRSVPTLMKIENELLDQAQTAFALLSPQQIIDLTRLKEDRNLCAHPAFVGEDVLFDPDPERVRFHLANAINHVMSQPPVQGKAAIARILADMQGVAFPVTAGDVETFVYQKYLAQGRDALVRNLVTVLIVQLFGGAAMELSAKHNESLLLLGAISRRNPDIYESVMPDALRKYVGPTADQVGPLCRLLASEPRCWFWLDDPKRIAIQSILNSYATDGSAPDAILGDIGDLASFEPLAASALGVFRKAALAKKSEMIKAARDKHAFVRDAFATYLVAGGFREAEQIGNALIVPLAESLSVEETNALLKIVAENRQIWQAGGTPSILMEVQRQRPDANWPDFLEMMKAPNSAYGYADLRAAAGLTVEDETF